MKFFDYFYENSNKLVTFDFDMTLRFVTGRPNLEYIALMKKYKSQGYKIAIVSTRKNDNKNYMEVVNFIKKYSLPINNIDVHLCGGSKVPTLKELKPEIHVEDDPDEANEIGNIVKKVILVTNWHKEWDEYVANDYQPTVKD